MSAPHTLMLNTLTATHAAELLTERRHFYMGGPTMYEGRPRSPREDGIFVRTEDIDNYNEADYVITSDRCLIAWHTELDGWVVPKMRFKPLHPHQDDYEFTKTAIQLTAEWQNQGEAQ